LALVSRVSVALVRSGRSLVCGCCVGVDAAVVSSVLSVAPSALASASPPLRVLCAFGAGGRGAGPASAVSVVSSFAASGGSVSWLVGGPAKVPLASRLRARTCAVAVSASSALVAFFGSPGSRGSFLACSLAAQRSVPVFAFPVGFPGSALPSLGSGSWVAVSGSGVWAGAFRWVPGQVSLF
jgi:hypothetical protein